MAPLSFHQNPIQLQDPKSSHATQHEPPLVETPALSLIWLFKQGFGLLFLTVKEDGKDVEMDTCNIVIFYGIKESFGGKPLVSSIIVCE